MSTPHIERHFTASDLLRDIVLGMSDGLTVPFALAAGLAGTQQPGRVVVAAGLAEIAAGAIAMGLGGWLAARGQAEHYEAERVREERELVEKPGVEAAEVATIFRGYGLPERAVGELVAALEANPGRYVDFMMRFELGLEAPEPRRALTSAATIATSYALGGLVPLAPYLLIAEVDRALPWSAAATLFVLALFGAAKGRFTGVGMARSSLQTTTVGALAAGAAFALARFVGG